MPRHPRDIRINAADDYIAALNETAAEHGGTLTALVRRGMDYELAMAESRQEIIAQYSGSASLVGEATMVAVELEDGSRQAWGVQIDGLETKITYLGAIH